jgi:hypothetical protein
MRKSPLLLGLVILLGDWPVAKAEQFPAIATIALNEVEARSGPSMSFYATSKLHYGDSVRLLGQEGDWYSIAPLAQDFSWIKADEVDQSGASATVKVPEAKLRVGSRLINQEPTVQRTPVKKGTQLIIIGKPEAGTEGTWLPVQPGPGEVRYIPSGAIRPAATVSQTAPPPLAGQTTSVTSAAPTPTIAAIDSGKNPLLIEAEKAEKSGNYAEAIKLYENLANQTASSNHTLSLACLNRAQYLRDRQRNGTAQGQQQPYSNTVNGRLVSMSGCTYVPTYPCVPAAPPPVPQYGYQADSSHTVRLNPPPGGTPAPPLAGQQPQWYGPGWLRGTALPDVDNKPVYALVNDRGDLLMYVTAGDGVDLMPYLNPPRRINVFGMITFNGFSGALRNNYMSVKQVAPLS